MNSVSEGSHNVVTVKNLQKKYKDFLALDGFSMEIRKGEILGLLGPNGSGKTTAINCILSLLNYDEGEITIFGEKMSPTSYEIKRKIGLIPQDIAVVDSLSVEENIDYFCGLYEKDGKLRKQWVKEALDFVKLEEFKKFLPKKLSGGLKRRLNIACGIAHKPSFLILDEPTVAIDAQSRNFVLSGIKELNRRGTSVLYTSHYLEEVEMLCDRIIVMDQGKSIASGSKEELIGLLPAGDIVEIEFAENGSDLEDIFEKIRALPHFMSLSTDKNISRIKFKSAEGILENFVRFLMENKLSYSNLNFSKPSLNDVFLFLTGKELRE